jgi:CCR4-NOT transcription complex subunit 1
MNAMTDWYMKAQDAEQNIRLARILDVSQDLKALSTLLNGQPLIFNIDLACLAARRGYLKLDKWMSDRIRDHGELFINTVVQFLKKKVPQLAAINKDDINSRSSVSIPLQPETVQTILKCIGSSSNSVSQELSQEIFQMNAQARLLLDKPNLQQNQQQANALPQQAIKSLTANQGPYDMIQSMINLNINNLNPTQIPNLTNFSNSPNKLLMSQISSISSSTNTPGLNNSAVSNSSNTSTTINNPIDTSKINALNNLLNSQQVRSSVTYSNPTTAGRSSLNSPQLPNNNESSDSNYSKEIEDEVDKCIQGLFKTNNPTLPAEDFISILARLKDSQEKKDKDFYNYALKYIIDGNTCLNDLNEMQFNTMASVWGGLIDRGILSAQMLSYCYKLLLQMLSKSPHSRYHIFGIKVLDRCKTRLKDFMNFCQASMQLSNFQELPRHLKDFIEYGARGVLPPSHNNQLPSILPSVQQQYNLSTSNVFVPSKYPNLTTQPTGSANTAVIRGSMGTKPSIANTTNIETLLVANENDSNSKPIAPSEIIQDKIGFIFNNLSLSNLQVKSEELKDVLKEDFWDWIAHYLVVKRVSIEPNFHTLYSHFIESLKKESLNENILAETYRNIKVLLRSDKNDQKFCDRALLKNLGSWLGLITLAKNKPILHRDIDLKSLIIEAFQKGQAELLFVVPFVAKVLEPASKSKIFQPPNPWLWSMLSVLVELHNEPDLKLNHKFEIEVLCKNLSLNINDIGVKGCLRNYEILEEQLTKLKDSNSGNTTVTAPLSEVPKVITPPSGPIGDQPGSGINNPATTQNTGNFITAKYKITDIKIQSLQNNSSLIYINPDVPLLNIQPALKNCIIPTLDKAVNEMMHLLLDKAVKISISTAEPIIKKDFSLDPEESHMRIAARNMVANMSSGMMLITGKEPLTSYLFNALKTQFSQPLNAELANAYKDLINQACGIIVQDNIELCMCFLQKNAIHRSIMELERKLQLEFETRLRSRTEGRIHYEPSILNYHNEKMPEMIKLRVGSISPQQFSVYEEFGKNLPGFKINSEERINQVII